MSRSHDPQPGGGRLRSVRSPGTSPLGHGGVGGVACHACLTPKHRSPPRRSRRYSSPVHRSLAQFARCMPAPPRAWGLRKRGLVAPLPESSALLVLRRHAVHVNAIVEAYSPDLLLGSSPNSLLGCEHGAAEQGPDTLDEMHESPTGMDHNRLHYSHPVANNHPPSGSRAAA